MVCSRRSAVYGLQYSLSAVDMEPIWAEIRSRNPSARPGFRPWLQKKRKHETCQSCSSLLHRELTTTYGEKDGRCQISTVTRNDVQLLLTNHHRRCYYAPSTAKSWHSWGFRHVLSTNGLLLASIVFLSRIMISYRL